MKSFIQASIITLLSLHLASAAPAEQAPRATSNLLGRDIALSKRYVGGWCGFHITQHQKNENGVGNDYTFDVRIVDAIQETVGGINGLDIPNYGSGDVSSQLPDQLVISVGAVDDDPIRFAYAGATWQSDNSAHCSMGGYDGGARQGDCGFTC